MSVSTVRKCDICGGREGFELKSRDFVSTPIELGMKDIDNNNVTISCVLNVKRDDGNGNETFLDDVVDSYDPIAYIPDAVYTEPYNVNTMLMDKHLEKAIQNQENAMINSGDICKKCHKNVLRLVNDYAKHDELIKF